MFTSPLHASATTRRPRARLGATLLATACLLLARSADARPVTRSDVIRLAIEGPDARAARARAAGARAAAEDSGAIALDNPELSASAGPRLDRVGTTPALSAGLAVPLDLFGQRASRMDAAEAEAHAAEVDARRAATVPLREALVLHAQALAARARRAIVKDRLRLVEELAETTQRRRQAGEVAENDAAVVRLQVARERAGLAIADGEVAALEQRLAAVLGLPEDEVAEATGPLVPADAPPRAATPTPTVAAVEAEAAAARARLDRAEAARRPTIRLLGGYELEEGAHVVTGGLSIPIPLYGVGDAAVAAARGEAVASAIALEGARRRAAAERQAARSRVAATRLAVDAMAPTAAEARAIVERAQRAYAAGESDLASLLLVRREALEGQLAVVDAELAHALALVDAMLLDGGWPR